MIWEAMQRGMAAGAWIVGFVAVAGLLVAVVYLFCVVMKYAFGQEEDEEGVEDSDGNAEAIAEGDGHRGYAPPVGRHLRRCAGGDD